MPTRRRPDWASPNWLVLFATSGAAIIVVMAMGIALVEGAQWQTDLAITRALQSVQEPVFRTVMIGVSFIGFTIPFLPFVVTVSLLLWWWQGLPQGLLVSLGTGVGIAVAFAIKEIVRRPRPAAPEVAVYQKLTDFSFPSEHVVTYVLFFGIVGYLAARWWPAGWYRWVALVGSGLAILLVGPSRVYLGAHWPSDVLAGYLVGYAVLVWSIFVFNWYTGDPASEPE
ncbi:MAG: phosphatase PAP2 family protein [Dehalococcoidales bacterium]|nr:phosphatase PAP2 family protein [Dehalococcoidales bacterium]